MQKNITDVYTDFSGLDQMRADAQQKDPEALRAAAKQFEAIFLQMTLKSMRDSVSRSSLFHSSEQDLYTGLFDHQLSLQLGQVSNLGIADMIFNQLGGDSTDNGNNKVEDYLRNPVQSLKPDTGHAEQEPVWISATAAGNPSVAKVKHEPWSNADEFVQHLKPAASRIADELDIPAEAILAVTALETGWGSRVIQRNEGGSSFNLFGIKATPDWSGESVVASTLEYSGGMVQRRQELFRSYGSAEDSLDDFAGLIKNNPRYKAALDSEGSADRFFLGLQNGGYATDPEYAAKLRQVADSDAIQNAFKK